MENRSKEQKYLGKKGLIALIALLSAFVPLSTDIYLPALPGMADFFGAPAKLVNLTLIMFFIFFAAGMLFWGPMSDRYGRKPALLAGVTIYVISSVLCACSASIYQLIAFRILQAIGGSVASAVSTAIVKDVYRFEERESILAIVQSMVMISPALAPVLGAFMLSFTSWRGVFWALAAIGFIALMGSTAFQDTIARRSSVTIVESIGRLGVVLRNPGFLSLLILFSMTSISAMAFVASSSYVYENGFGVSEQAYSYYFALNAMGLLFGPMLYVKLSERHGRGQIINACFITIALSGVLVYLVGNISPLLFAFSILPATIAGVCSRPPGTNLMLEQQQEDAGSASSLMGCFTTIMGTIGMLIISLDWGSIIAALGIIYIAIGLTGLALWTLISKMSIIKQAPAAEAR
ncbi:drug resistance transporter, Bcr/CflA subfamily [Methanocella conradii HZ254]|uniref:Drug resistance transporter, Bcr/CflA subfamily n=1 Tax=Methanocella conradii (strain DSM 24694 / JCM 17849 / CGMCC 1.5162 / HZ254) TaxID=1041930 RepID=H8I736_METCZ|nr:multidrug effflux MFS transporter [Methanocella conradii]AFD00287.1 drug resistance transporter, Bcr/CflA subfamily [Methanocella conradii HZ254]